VPDACNPDNLETADIKEYDSLKKIFIDKHHEEKKWKKRAANMS
jgi:hypothetical protein